MRYFLLFIVTVFFVSCSENANNGFTPSLVKKKPLKLVRVNQIILKGPVTSLKKPFIGFLNHWFRMSPDASRIAFADRIYEHIVVTDMRGRTKIIVGKKGKGPSEFVEIENWCFDEHNNLLVYDNSQKLLKIFNPKGKLIHTLKIGIGKRFYVSGRGFYASDGLIFVPIIQVKYSNRSERSKSKMVAVYDYQGHLKKIATHYDPYVEKSPDYLTMAYLTIQFSHHLLYSANENSYRVQVWNLQTWKRTAYFGYRSQHYKEAAETIDLHAPFRKIQKEFLHQSDGKRVYVTSNFILRYFINTTKKYVKHRMQDNPQYLHYFIAVYDKKNHDFINELTLPGYLGAVKNNKLYILENPNPDHYTIGVYKIQQSH